MNNFEPVDFEAVLESIEEQVNDLVEFDDIRSVGGNFNTRGMSFKAKDNPNKTGTIIVGQDEGEIAVDISLLDGAIRSFVLQNEEDEDGINEITEWFEENYS